MKKGITVENLLYLLGLDGLAGELIIVVDGASVTPTDRLNRSGKVIIPPVVCGG